MSLPSRRALLGASLAGGAAAVLAACDSDEDAKPAPGAPGASESPDFDPQDWESVRAQFNLDPELAQFAAFVLSPHTQLLDAAIAGYAERLGRDTEQVLLEASDLEQAVRVAAAQYAGGQPGQFALTDSTTMGIATMYGGLRLAPGDEVLTTTHDFYSTEDALRLLSEGTGAKLTRVSLYDDPSSATVDEMVGRLAAGVTPRTKVVAITWVHSSTGVRVPVAEICAALEAMSRVPRDQYVVCVDGVHGFSAVDVDLPDLGCDFLAAGTHKWLFGPRGTGILWGRDWAPLRELIPSFTPDAGSGRMTRGRLPLLRAPVGTGRRVRVHGPDRPRPGRGPDRGAGHPAQGGAGRHPRLAGHPDGPGGVRGDRVPRRARRAARQRRAQPA